MKLKDLKTLVKKNTIGGKLPTYKQLQSSNTPIILQLNTGNVELTVYDNGLVTYSDVISGKIHNTVFCIDKLELRYEFANKYTPSIKLSDYPELEEYDAVEFLSMCGKDRLDYNTYNRESYHGSKSITDEGLHYETKMRPNKKLLYNKPDFTDRIINKIDSIKKDERYHFLEDAMNHLTEKQLQVIELYYYEQLTQQAIADRLGISRTSVQDRHDSALKKLRKYIKK